MCAVRPVKGAGAEPWDNRPWGTSRGSPVYTEEQSVQREARRARDPDLAPEEPDETHRWSISDALLPSLKQLTRTR